MNRDQRPTHAEILRQRRAQQTSRRLTQTTQRACRPTVYQSATARAGYSPQTTRRKRRTHDATVTIARAGTHASVLPSIQFSARWLSGLLTAALAFIVYTMWTSPTFTITGAEIYNNQRLGATEINASLGIIGRQIFLAVPERIEQNLRMDYPDLANVEVHITFPNRVIVEVVERTPLLAWYQDDILTWIDSEGVAFKPRGEAAGLIPVVSNGSPPQVPTETATPPFARPFISPKMVTVIAVLYPYVPTGAPMTYDPQYGMGWQDSRGWDVYFGQNTENIPMKIQVYQAIVDKLTREGIQPTIISVEYLEAPFYRTH